MFKDYYQILDVSFSASKEEIKKAYRKMSLQWHPDRNPGADVTEMMQDINEAYKILNDGQDMTRSIYYSPNNARTANLNVQAHSQSLGITIMK